MRAMMPLALSREAIEQMTVREGVVSYVDEASTLGLPIGCWPSRIEVGIEGSGEVVFNLKRLNRSGDDDGEILDAVYDSEDMNLRLVVLND